MNVNFQSVNYTADTKLVEFTQKRVEKDHTILRSHCRCFCLYQGGEFPK